MAVIADRDPRPPLDESRIAGALAVTPDLTPELLQEASACPSEHAAADECAVSLAPAYFEA